MSYANITEQEIELSIIIPAYKEGKKIKIDIEMASKFLNDQKLSGEIIVVDDGSPDETTSLALSLQNQYPELKVLRYETNRGKGYALRYGMKNSRGNKVLFADSGLCISYEIALLGLIMLNLNMCDVAHGSRRMRGSVVKEQPLYRTIGSKVYSIVVHILMGIPLYISDTQCGFKIYRGDLARKLYKKAFTDGFMIDIEIILHSLKAGYRILEFPVLWSNDADTRYAPVKGTWRNFIELLNIKFKLMKKL